MNVFGTSKPQKKEQNRFRGHLGGVDIRRYRPSDTADGEYSELVSEAGFGDPRDIGTATVVTGQTPQSSSIPFGSLKQLVATCQTAERLEDYGVDTDLVFLNADSFVPENSDYSDSYQDMVENFSDAYDQIEHIRTSELSSEIEGQHEDLVREIEERNPQTAAYATDYTIEEIASIRELDLSRQGSLIKIGPPQEGPYDSIFAETFHDSELRGVYLTPTVPLERGMNTAQIEEMADSGGVIPYHDFGARIYLEDAEGEIEDKKEDASERTQEELEAVKGFLDRKGGARSLGEHFDQLVETETSSDPGSLFY